MHHPPLHGLVPKAEQRCIPVGVDAIYEIAIFYAFVIVFWN